jgi:O-antigen/teichoic acid export membrane protein
MSLKMKIKTLYKDSLIKNSIYLIATNFSNVGIGFLFWVITARYYTPKDVGIISAILSSMLLISMIGSIGFPTALIFYLPRYHKYADRVINSCLMITVMVSLVFSLIFVLGIKIWAPDLRMIFGELKYIVTFVIFTIMTALSAVISGAFIAERRSSFHMVKENIFGIIKIFPLILLAGFGAIGIFISWGFGLIIAVFIGFILLYRYLKYYPKFAFDPIIKNMAHFSIGNYVSDILYSLPKIILPIMILNLISAESAGYFFIAMTMAGILYGVPQSMANSLLAETSNSRSEGILYNVNKAIIFSLGLVILGLLVFMIFGKFILNIFNTSYAQNSFTILIILSVASIPLSLINIFNTVRNIQNKVVSLIKVNMMVAIMTLGLSFPLIKILGIEGAAIAYLVSTSITATVIIYRINNLEALILKLLDNVNVYSKKLMQ